MTATVRIEKIRMPTDEAPWGMVWYEVTLPSADFVHFVQRFQRGAAGRDVDYGLFWGWDGTTPLTLTGVPGKDSFDAIVPGVCRLHLTLTNGKITLHGDSFPQPMEVVE